MTATIKAEELAEMLGVSPWSIYNAVRRQEAPIGTMAVRCGRRLVWPRAAVDRMLGLDPEPAT